MKCCEGDRQRKKHELFQNFKSGIWLKEGFFLKLPVLAVDKRVWKTAFMTEAYLHSWRGLNFLSGTAVGRP